MRAVRAVRAEIHVWLYICLLAWHVVEPEGLEHRPCTVIALYLFLHARDRVLCLTLPPLRLLLRIAAEHRPLHIGQAAFKQYLERMWHSPTLACRSSSSRFSTSILRCCSIAA